MASKKTNSKTTKAKKNPPLKEVRKASSTTKTAPLQETAIVVSKAEVVDPNEGAAQMEELESYEKIVFNGVVAAYESGAALETIREKKLYRARGYSRFEDYVKKFFEISKVYAYRLINYNRIRALLGEDKSTRVTERLLRPLSSIEEEEDVKRLWNRAKTDSNEELPNSKVLAKVVADFHKAQKNEKAMEKAIKDDAKGFFSKTLCRRIRIDSVKNSTDFIVKAANSSAQRLQSLYADFSPHFKFDAEAKKQLIAQVEKWQQAELQDFRSKING